MAETETVPSQEVAQNSNPSSNAGEVFGVWTDIFSSIPLDNPFAIGILIFAAVVASAFGTFIIYLLWQKRSVENDDGYEKKPLEDTISEDTTHALDTTGASTDQPFRYNLRTIGQIFKMTEFSEFDNLEKQLKILSEKDDNNIEFSEKSLESLNENLDAEDLVTEGILDAEQKQKFKEDNFVPHRLIAVRDRGFLNKVNWMVRDQMFGASDYTHYYMMPEPLIIDGGDHIQAPRNVQFRNIGGVEVPLYRSSMAILFSMVQRHGMEIALEDLENYSDRLNSGDPQFVQDMAKLVKRAEIENQRDGKGVAGDINDS